MYIQLTWATMTSLQCKAKFSCMLTIKEPKFDVSTIYCSEPSNCRIQLLGKSSYSYSYMKMKGFALIAATFGSFLIIVSFDVLLFCSYNHVWAYIPFRHKQEYQLSLHFPVSLRVSNATVCTKTIVKFIVIASHICIHRILHAYRMFYLGKPQLLHVSWINSTVTIMKHRFNTSRYIATRRNTRSFYPCSSQADRRLVGASLTNSNVGQACPN